MMVAASSTAPSLPRAPTAVRFLLGLGAQGLQELSLGLLDHGLVLVLGAGLGGEPGPGVGGGVNLLELADADALRTLKRAWLGIGASDDAPEDQDEFGKALALLRDFASDDKELAVFVEHDSTQKKGRTMRLQRPVDDWKDFLADPSGKCPVQAVGWGGDDLEKARRNDRGPEDRLRPETAEPADPERGLRALRTTLRARASSGPRMCVDWRLV